MASTVQRLVDRGIAKPPGWLPSNTQYETIMGSVAYGVSSDTSDMDVYGFCIPPKEDIFTHLRGDIEGFGRQKKRFNQYSEHHLKSDDRSYDLTIYNIVDYFQLLMENNPNMIDSIFTPHECVIHSTRVGVMVRENRRLFLHKGSWHKFKGYAYSQIHKMTSKERTGARKEEVEKHGYDLKFAYHVVRLLDEVEQILTEEDLDLRRNREQLKSIRRGEWTVENIRDHFNRKESELESLYTSSKLRHSPDEPRIKRLLLDCLEEHYGSLSECVVDVDAAKMAIREIAEVIRKRGLL